MLKKIKVMDTLNDYYSKRSTLSGYLTGTITGWLKYSTLNEREKKQLAKQLLWCYEQSGAELTEMTRKEIEDILNKKS